MDLQLKSSGFSAGSLIDSLLSAAIWRAPLALPSFLALSCPFSLHFHPVHTVTVSCSLFRSVVHVHEVTRDEGVYLSGQ